MFRKYTEYLTLILLVLVLNSCSAIQGYSPSVPSGDVIELSYNSTLAGMRMAVQGIDGTYVMVKEGLTTLIWTMKGCNGVGFVVLDTEQGAFLDQWQYVSAKGNFTSGSSMKALTDYLTNNAGWKMIPAAQLADGIKNTVLSTSGKGTWVTSVGKIPVFMVIFDSPVVNPFYTLRIVQY